jgi:hypothetical protein
MSGDGGGGLVIIYQTQFTRPDDRFGPVAGIQLPLDVAGMRFDSTQADEQLFGDFLIARSGAHQA